MPSEVYLFCNTRDTPINLGFFNTNLQIVLNTKKNPYLNQAGRKNTRQIFLPKSPGNENSNPPKSFDHPRHLKSGVPPEITGLHFFLVQDTIGHLRVPADLCFKTRVGAQPWIWKSFFILMQIKLIFTRKVMQLASFCK